MLFGKVPCNAAIAALCNRVPRAFCLPNPRTSPLRRAPPCYGVCVKDNTRTNYFCLTQTPKAIWREHKCLYPSLSHQFFFYFFRKRVRRSNRFRESVPWSAGEDHADRAFNIYQIPGRDENGFYSVLRPEHRADSFALVRKRRPVAPFFAGLRIFSYEPCLRAPYRWQADQRAHERREPNSPWVRYSLPVENEEPGLL